MGGFLKIERIGNYLYTINMYSGDCNVRYVGDDEHVTEAPLAELYGWSYLTSHKYLQEIER